MERETKKSEIWRWGRCTLKKLERIISGGAAGGESLNFGPIVVDNMCDVQTPAYTLARIRANWSVLEEDVLLWT